MWWSHDDQLLWHDAVKSACYYRACGTSAFWEREQRTGIKSKERAGGSEWRRPFWSWLWGAMSSAGEEPGVCLSPSSCFSRAARVTLSVQLELCFGYTWLAAVCVFFFFISVCTVLLLTLPRPSHSGGVKTCSVRLWKDNVHCLCSKSGNCSWCSWSCLEVCACLSTGCAVTAIRKTEMQYWRLNEWTSHCLPTHTHTPQPSESLKESLMWQEAWIWQHGMT